MSDMKNIYDVLDEIGFENQCEKYALGFYRDTDTPTMTKFRQESTKEFCFGLIQQYAEKVYEDFIRTRKALDIAVDALKSAHEYYEYCIQRDKDYGGDDINWDCTAMNMDNDISEALEQITALEQKDVK